MRLLGLSLLLALAGCDLLPFEPPADGGSGGGGAQHCAADGDCDDFNPCTVDRCQAGACTHALADPGVSCSDGDPCNGLETCDGMGRCQPGTPLPSCAPSPWTPTSLTGAPSPRQRHTAVWTGSKMIVWGGSVSGQPAVTATGGVFDPQANTWTPTSMTGAPSPRHSHRAVWTGSKMIVWGGFGAVDLESSGGVYDPATDTWAPLGAVGAPSGRIQFSMIWTGSQLVVWGGLAGTKALGDGAVYNDAKSTWTPTPFALAPTQRFNHTAVWSGSRMIVWGGNDLFDWHNDGALFNPLSGTWDGPTDTTAAPEPREGQVALWTDKAMLVWGGWTGGPYVNTGGLYDPFGAPQGTWTAMTTAAAPAARAEHAAVWTGKSFAVWGGCGSDTCSTLYGDGGVFTPDPKGGAWMTLAADASLAARKRHTAVWTGTQIIVWGGLTDQGVTDSGAARTLP